MANWLQLLEHTAEFTPWPWTMAETLARGRPVCQVVSQMPGAVQVIAEVMPTPMAVRDRAAGGDPVDWDQERSANGSLIADAPTMVFLLARWMHFTEGKGKSLAEDIKLLDALDRDTTALLARHVRVGYEPPRLHVPGGGGGPDQLAPLDKHREGQGG